MNEANEACAHPTDTVRSGKFRAWAASPLLLIPSSDSVILGKRWNVNAPCSRLYLLSLVMEVTEIRLLQKSTPICWVGVRDVPISFIFRLEVSANEHVSYVFGIVSLDTTVSGSK